ncbi:hypothetical protein N7492_006737 [Penicillium capsulatum]|uniref:Alpha-N-acetylglucosaminidase n=1 Tax=Penicillium capsulatum TaxID=69766 RepID=A0A9W9LKN2_9EURO|nr:hypothetical protein N7492_006737 [Penicillium capsulatum]KAJ6116572.1 hypothetical protein N7512_006297 [Penicillium capsulatum]
MQWVISLLWLLAASAAARSTDGLYKLVERRLPNHVGHFRFEISNQITASHNYDQFVVKTTANGTVGVQGNTISALSSGLHRYLTNIAHVDIYWFIGSRLHLAPSKLPLLDKPLNGSSTVYWRYHFNTGMSQCLDPSRMYLTGQVTFSYTAAFWTWEDWELELDWMALRGVNLPLAWPSKHGIASATFRAPGMVIYPEHGLMTNSIYEIVYDLFLDQAWSNTAIDTRDYFHRWVQSRYTGSGPIPKQLYEAWEIMRKPVYSNTNPDFSAVPKSVFEPKPAISGLLSSKFGHGTNLTYEPAVVVKAWKAMREAADLQQELWSNPAYQHDVVDVTRQVLTNAFIPMYEGLVSTYNTSGSADDLLKIGHDIVELLRDLDAVLFTNENFRLSTWIGAARNQAHGDADYASYLEYQARNQITLWGPNGEISDYASKQWAGLVSSYYVPRWALFIAYFSSTPAAAYNETELNGDIRKFELSWQEKALEMPTLTTDNVDLQKVLDRVQQRWRMIFTVSE